MKRVILIVMDGCGVGALPDASEYGASDPSSNTLGHVAESVPLHLPNLQKLGLGNITPMPGVGYNPKSLASFGKCAELSKGKDSVTGHWEMMGVVTEMPFPTYPNGFPHDLIAEFERLIGRMILGNRSASGTEIISELGAEHVATGKPIVYTSADSVFQIAAHEQIIPVEQLYRYCETARRLLIEPNHVQRVIARPFLGDEIEGFVRTAHRKDYPLPPPEPNILTALRSSRKTIQGIGVVTELFPGRSFDFSERTQSNLEHAIVLKRAIRERKADLIFANFEDFDMLYGHRNDVQGFAKCIEKFDVDLGEILAILDHGDLLILTADHGNDPTTSSTDHSREYVPLLIYSKSIRNPRSLGVRLTFADIGATICRYLEINWSGAGRSVIEAGFT